MEPEALTIYEMEAMASRAAENMREAGRILANGRKFSMHEIATALEFAEVPGPCRNRALALLSFLASLP